MGRKGGVHQENGKNTQNHDKLSQKQADWANRSIRASAIFLLLNQLLVGQQSLDEKIVDKVYAFYAPILIGGKKAVTVGGKGINKINNALCLKRISIKRFQDNFLIIGSQI